MTHVPKFPKAGKRVVYVNLDEELDEGGQGIDRDFWIPREGSLTALCRANCNVVSDTACDQSKVINNTLFTPRARGALNTSLCSADAVNDITRKWPPSEPYALASPSCSDLKPRNLKRRKYKERHNYAKALLRSEKELENLSLKIRTEIQHSEMLELALEAERAANAGLLSFSAKPSTFGSEKPNVTASRTNLLRSRAFSEGSQPFTVPQIPAYKELKRVELRNVCEVIPPWKELHSHMRTHMFRSRVPEDYLSFGVSKAERIPLPEANLLDRSTRSLARNSLQFFENLADTTMSKIKKHSIMAHRPLCHLSNDDEDSAVNVQDSTSRMSRSSKAEPTLSSPLSPMSKNHDCPVSDEIPGMEHPEDFDRGSSGCTSSNHVPMIPEIFGNIEKNRRYKKNNQSPVLDSAMNSAVAQLKNSKEDHQHTHMDPASGPLPGNIDDLKSTENITYSPRYDDMKFAENASSTPRRDYSSHSRNTGFETPAGLRDIRARSDWASSRRRVHTPVLSNAYFEPSSIVESYSLGADDGKCGTPRMLENDDALFLALPVISGRSKEQASGRSWGSGALPRRKLSQKDSNVYPALKSKGGVDHDTFLGNFQSMESRFGEEKKESELFYGSEERLCDGSENYFTKELPLDEKTEGHRRVEVTYRDVEHSMRDPISCDLESCDDESSASAARGTGHDDTLSLLSATWGEDVNTQDKILIRRTLSWPRNGDYYLTGGTTAVTSLRTSLPLTGGTAETTSAKSSHSHTESQPKRNNTPKFIHNRGMCHEFASPDEHFHVAVEAMIAGLSPTSPSWRKEQYFGEDANDEFLTNYFYRTRHGGNLEVDPRRRRGRMCVEACQDDDMGVDVCNDIYHIVSGSLGGIAFDQSRKRAVSLDARVPAAPFTRWFGAFESLFGQCGSSSEGAPGKSSTEQAQFDPPHLKKTSK